MQRRLVNLAAAVSLVLCVATLAFWASGRSWTTSPVWRETRPLTKSWYALTLGQGAVWLSVLTPDSGRPVREGNFQLGFGTLRTLAYAIAPGGGPNIHLGDIESLAIPFWFVVLLTAVLPLSRFWMPIRARLMTPRGHCPSCGYDLRATPDRCPECGAPAPKAGEVRVRAQQSRG